MYLSKSKYCNAVQCKKMLWLNEYKPEEKESLNESVLENGTQVGELAKNLFGFHIDVSFNENLKQMIEDTKSLLYLDKVVITEASFEYDNNFCSVDILKKNKSDFEIYEVRKAMIPINQNRDGYHGFYAGLDYLCVEEGYSCKGLIISFIELSSFFRA